MSYLANIEADFALQTQTEDYDTGIFNPALDMTTSVLFSALSADLSQPGGLPPELEPALSPSYSACVAKRSCGRYLCDVISAILSTDR